MARIIGYSRLDFECFGVKLAIGIYEEDNIVRDRSKVQVHFYYDLMRNMHMFLCVYHRTNYQADNDNAHPIFIQYPLESN